MPTTDTFKAARVYDPDALGFVEVEQRLKADFPEGTSFQVRHDERYFHVWAWTPGQDGADDTCLYDLRIEQPRVVVSDDIIDVTGFVKGAYGYQHLRLWLFMSTEGWTL